MANRKSLDKMEARARRDRLLEQAAQGRLPPFDAVREMRAIAGMTQEEFAQHRGVSARVIKELERGQGNPTVGTLNRIGEFFGLEVAFVPRARPAATQTAAPSGAAAAANAGGAGTHRQLIALEQLNERLEQLDAVSRRLSPLQDLAETLNNIQLLGERWKTVPELSKYLAQGVPANAAIKPTRKPPARKKPAKDR